MKTLKFIIPIAGLLLASVNVNSQTIYEADRFTGSDLNGTARFVGMGGAMGALGGDLSTMGTNPAGIGIYRSSDLNVSFGFSNVGNKSQFNSTSVKNDKFFGSFDNVGFVLALKQGNYTPVRFINFGFNYRKLKSFDRNVSLIGTGGVSQTQQITQMVLDNEMRNGEIDLDYLNSVGAYWNSGIENIPWLAPLAYQANLLVFEDGGFYPYINGHTVKSDYHTRERGALHSYDFNIALNFYDRVYLGATLGAYSVDYTRYTKYYEQFLAGGEYDGNYVISNDLEIDGTGIDFKLGVIVRPFESSPFKFGASITTPTYFNLTAYQGTSLTFDTYNYMEGIDEFVKATISPYDMYERYMPSENDFKIVSPWKYNLSLGYTIGSSVALGAEYEYMDYGTSKFKDYDGEKMTGENEQAKRHMKGSSAIRLGAEFKLAPEFSFRVGYNHITSAFEKSAQKELPINTVRTDTDYFNKRAVNNYTIGLGYRGEHFYADMAYKYQNYKEDFYAFNYFENTTPAKITNDKHQLLFTLGMRF